MLSGEVPRESPMLGSGGRPVPAAAMRRRPTVSIEAEQLDFVEFEAGVAPRCRDRQPRAALRARRPRRHQRPRHDRQPRRLPAGPPRIHAARQDDRRRDPAWRAAAHRRGAGHRQDHDGAPDGAQRRLRRPGQRALHLLRARGALPAHPSDRDGIRPRAPAPQVRRDQDPGSPPGDPELLGGRGERGSAARREPAPAALDRPDRPLRAEPLPDARDAVGDDRRQHAAPRDAPQGDLRRPAADGLRRLPAEGPAVPGARHGDGEDHRSW